MDILNGINILKIKIINNVGVIQHYFDIFFLQIIPTINAIMLGTRNSSPLTIILT